MKMNIVQIGAGFAVALLASRAGAATPAENYAACLVATRPAQVHQLLDAQTAQVANPAYATLSSDDRCVSRVFRNDRYLPEDAGASMDVLRGRLAEQLLRADPAVVAALQPLPLQQKRYIREWFAATGRHPAVDEMAACMADTDPGGIAALIATSPDSADENAGIGALTPALSKCLSAGTRLDADRHALRAALADAMYQRLKYRSSSVAVGKTERGR